MKLKTKIVLVAATLSSSLLADTVLTKDGAELIGEITLVDKGVIHLKTAYAGELKIKQDQVTDFFIDRPKSIRMEDGAVASGALVASDDIRGASVPPTTDIVQVMPAQVSAVWGLDDEDPEIVRNRQKWSYEASLDLTGRTGTTEKVSFGAAIEAERSGPNDTLSLFAEYDQAESEGIETEDRIAGGASYESFYSKVFGWYVRTELEKDDIDRIDLRSTTGAGVSYRLIKNDRRTLVVRTGLGYRYTMFDDEELDDESDATLDFGLTHTYKFSDKFKMKNELTYVPAIGDFGDYRAIHDSGFEIPIGNGENWKIKTGIKNEYESQTTDGNELDTHYYTRMIFSWGD